MMSLKPFWLVVLCVRVRSRHGAVAPLTPQGEIKYNRDDFPLENGQNSPLTGLPV